MATLRISFCLAGLLGVAYAQGIPVQLWVTTSDAAGVVAGLEAQPDLRFRQDAGDGVMAIRVDDTKVFQKMEGGGATIPTAPTFCRSPGGRES